MQTAEHFGELLFFCLDCEHSWTVHPGKLPPRTRMETVPAASDDRIAAQRAERLRFARQSALAARAAAARAASMRLAIELNARRDVSLYLRELVRRARAITDSVH